MDSNALEALALFIPISFIVFLFATIITIVSNRHKIKMRQLELQTGDVSSDALDDLKSEVDQLTIENAAIKRELARLQKRVEASEQRIELTPYEREQIKLDQSDKFTL